MAAGADLAAVSMHKSGGSLTQSSLLLTGPDVHAGYVRQIINLTQTTSGSYLLMSSLDISRRNLAQRGRQIFHQVADMAEYAREEINAIGGYYAFGKELVNGDSVFDFDITKLSVHTLDICERAHKPLYFLRTVSNGKIRKNITDISKLYLNIIFVTQNIVHFDSSAAVRFFTR